MQENIRTATVNQTRVDN